LYAFPITLLIARKHPTERISAGIKPQFGFFTIEETNMKTLCVLFLFAATCAASAQTSTPQTPPPSAQGQTGAGTAQGTAPRGRMGGMRGMGMNQQHLQQMQADLNHMHALLNSMRANLSSMSPKDQPAMQSNVEMWQIMVNHMDSMMQHVQMMQGMGTPGGGQPGQTAPPPR
jgi:hypothetical protein